MMHLPDSKIGHLLDRKVNFRKMVIYLVFSHWELRGGAVRLYCKYHYWTATDPIIVLW